MGSKPNLPNDLIKNILPNTPAIVFPVSPKEYFLKRYPVILAPTIPIKILIKEIPNLKFKDLFNICKIDPNILINSFFNIYVNLKNLY